MKIADVKRHGFFEGVVWDDVLSLSVPVPFKPKME